MEKTVVKGLWGYRNINR